MGSADLKTCYGTLRPLKSKMLAMCHHCHLGLKGKKRFNSVGNRRGHRTSEEPGFFDGEFLAQDSEVSTFVEDVRGAVKSILWNARNQEGAGTTLGEEVEQVNSFLSRCALTTKYMAKSDRNKRRQKIVQKIAQEKKRLLEDIHKYNQQPDDGVDILTKKGLFDQEMLLSRLTEEKQILVKEMMQHCQYLKDSVSKVQTLMAPVSLITQTGSYPNGITEEGYKGLMCLLRRNLDDLRLKQQTVAGAYRGILGPSPRLVEEDDEDMEEENDWQSDNSSDDEDDAEEGT
ncbi:hypothetical protein NQZ68_036310 [Dissostichus eleginoides]|nr:hypothetical protein NQZ68_036310 [Dissostichus eleginoides]